MSLIAQAQLCRYHYDAMDRLARSELQGQISLKLFYKKNRLTTHIQGHTQHTLLHADEQLLALRVGQNQTTTHALLATDQQASVIATRGERASFTPYGHRHPQANSMSLPGFNGQQADRVTGHYLLGNGYRAFNPVLMRFNSPDRLSPFGEGGLNAYAYCMGDPVNRDDSTGHTPAFIKRAFRFMGLIKKSPRATNPKMKNFIPLSEDVYTFEDVIEGQKRLNISAHGGRSEGSTAWKMVMNKMVFSAKQIHSFLQQKSYDLEKYKQIRLIFCYSADGGQTSFAAEFADLTQKPVTGFKGKVADNRSVQGVARTVADIRKQYPKQSDSAVAEYYSKRKHKILLPTDQDEIVDFLPKTSR
ncbi:RHS repeat-associated core domain-containing protein [Pseudomonas alliivorans]|uniref:RHS repeat-associated core domain-containing protein n=1 Tax=Pseudomonas alliivorans TaxID=2810613 RepID=UPI00211BDF17|nr:RHS repeat-associated core domain-containing protein [Pseudomonas alliivorans]MCQ9468871.1 RHS repeat-associated core domain-containing protein [Pseudomonas alliivorans]